MISSPGGRFGSAVFVLALAACSTAGGAQMAENQAETPPGGPPTSGLESAPAEQATTGARSASSEGVAAAVPPTGPPASAPATLSPKSSPKPSRTHTVSTTTAPPTTASPTSVPAATITSSPATTTVQTTTVPATSTSSTTTPGAVDVGAFSFTIEPATAEQLGLSWRPGCPVGPEDLRTLTVKHLGSDGTVRDGALVVHRDWAEPLAGVFRDLFEARFVIERIEPVDRYGADDGASMAANNTSAFNCRPVAGTTRWSEHSYGQAVDLNPLINPYVKGGVVDPPGGAAYLDRTVATPGLITADGVAVAAFAAIGWRWGGDWQSAKDYQHFSATGR